MILPDTAIWIDHIHDKDEQLASLLRANRVLIHPFVVGEIALGSMKHYDALVASLLILEPSPVALDHEVRLMIKQNRLMGSGIGYVDAHILASAMLLPSAFIWTRDERLNAVALRLGVAWTN